MMRFIPPFKYRVTVLIITQAGRFHFIKTDPRADPNFVLKYGGKEYQVKKAGLYRYPKSGAQVTLEQIRRERNYLIVFRYGSEDHLTPGNPEVSPEELAIYGTSRALRDGINEKFRESMGGKSLILIGAAIVAAYIFAVYMGWVPS